MYMHQLRWLLLLLTVCLTNHAMTAQAPLMKAKTNPRDGAVMVWVPAGEFHMGSTPKEITAAEKSLPAAVKKMTPVRFKAEAPQHKIMLDGYWIYQNDVTVAQYRKFCTATKRAMPNAPDWGWLDEHPMVNMTWDEALAYAKWVGAALPTEAEWEKAARGTDGRIYPWGNKWDATKCNNEVGKKVWSLGKTSPVGSYPAGASPYGCLDMAGNVWQWCADWYGADYYRNSPSRNPTGPASGSTRVVRGGCWGRFATGFFRTATRVSHTPNSRDVDVGFRCVVHSR